MGYLGAWRSLRLFTAKNLMEKAEADFKKSDTNGHGKIDFNEFVANLSHFVI